MSITIAPTDFSEDIVDTVRPMLDALGLLDSSGNLDVSNWNIDKAFKIFETYERTETILDVLSSFLGLPEVFHREIDYSDGSISGLISNDNQGNPSNHYREEWYTIYPFDDSSNWGVHLIVVHERTGTDSHEVNVGLGISIKNLEITNQVLNARLSIPIVGVVSDYSTSTPSITTQNLIWGPSAKERISLDAQISDSSGNYTVLQEECSSISLGIAIGDKPPCTASCSGTCTCPPAKVKLSLDDFGPIGGPYSDLVIDSWGSAGAIISNIVDGILPALLDKINVSGSRIYEDLLPMLGILDSDEAPGTWPRIDIVNLMGNISNPESVLDELRNWMLEMAQPEIGKYWFMHLYRLLTGEPTMATILPPIASCPSTTCTGTHCICSGKVQGLGTTDEPWSLSLADGLLDFNILLAMNTDENGVNWVKFGVEAAGGSSIGAIDLIGSLQTWILDIPIDANSQLGVLPEIDLSLTINNPGGDLIAAEPTSADWSSFDLNIESARLALRRFSDGQIIPAIELVNVRLGNPPTIGNQWDILDMTSGDAYSDILGAGLDAFRNTISNNLADGGLLQWAGSLVGLVAPRGYPFRPADEWQPSFEYSEGDLITNAAFTKVYRVTLGGLSHGTDEPSHTSGSSPNGAITLEYLGAHELLWETGTPSDLRVDLGDLVTQPLCAIANYHRNLLDQTIELPGGGNWSSDKWSAWSFTFEALGNIIYTAICEILNSEKPEMLEGEDPLLTGNKIDGPWEYTFADGTTIPLVDLTANHTGSGNVKLGVTFELARLFIGENLHLSPRLTVDLLDITFPVSPSCTVPTTLLTGASFGVKIADLMNTTPEPIELLNIAGISISIDEIYALFEWRRVDGFGWSIGVKNPIVGALAPDLSGLVSNLPSGFDLSLLSGLSWDGIHLYLPDGTFVIPSITVHPIPALSIDFGDGTGPHSLSWIWDGFGTPGQDIEFGSWGGLIGIDAFFGGFNFSTGTPLTFVQLRGVRILLGQLLAVKCGSLGFFISVFFRLNPHLIHFDLGAHLRKFEFDLPDISMELPDWPSDWLAFHNADSPHFGLGPFSLPLDWPEIHWNNLFVNPWVEFKRFIVELFGGVSSSGEPFALPALRWIWGLFSGSLPNLNLPNLGWGSDEGTSQFSISLPDIPVDIIGDGTYDNPWSISLSAINLPNFEFIVWVDPDGIPNDGIMSYVTGMFGESILNMLTTTIDAETANLELAADWPNKLALVLHRLAEISPRISHGIGKMSVDELASALIVLDNFLKNSDGAVSINSQWDAGGDWADQVNTQPYHANHLTALQNQDVIDDCISFIDQVIDDELNPASIPWKIILMGPPWMPSNCWDTFLSNIQTKFGITAATDSHFDLDSFGLNSIANLNVIDLSSIAVSDCYTMVSSLSIGTDATTEEILAKQVSVAVDRILELSTSPVAPKIFLIGHSVGGLSVSHYTSGVLGTTPDDKVAGAMTIATPHNGIDIPIEIQSPLDRAIHLLELIGAINSGNFDPSSITSTPDWLDQSTIEQLLSFVIQFRADPQIVGGLIS